jgi:hypothetical protein
MMQLPLSASCVNDTDLINDIIKLSSHAPLEPVIYKYNDRSFMKLLGKGIEAVFTTDELSKMLCLYQQLNPGYTVKYITPFHFRYGRVSISGDILGSTLNGASAQSSSTIAAYWPTFGSNVNNFDHTILSIGKVQYYFSHSVTLEDSVESKIVNYTFAFCHWMNYHHQNRYFGISATVCANSTKEPSLCCNIPVLRIYAKCATCTVTINDDITFVACHVPLKLSC